MHDVTNPPRKTRISKKKKSKYNYSKKYENSVRIGNLNRNPIENLITIDDRQQSRDFLLFEKMIHAFFYMEIVPSTKHEIVFILRNYI